MKLGVQQKKWLHLIQPSQDPKFIFSLIQGLRVRVEVRRKSEKVCMCVCVWRFFVGVYISKVRSHFWVKFGMAPSIYRALMLLNFCGDWGRGLGARTKLLGVSNWRKLLGSKVLGQAWANRRSRSTGRLPTVWQSIAKIIHSKKFIKIERCYLFMVGVTSFFLS